MSARRRSTIRSDMLTSSLGTDESSLGNEEGSGHLSALAIVGDRRIC